MNNNQILLESLRHKISEIPLILYKSLGELFALTQTECRIYLSLLLYDALSAREIAQVTRVPRTKVYGHIKSLVSKEIITERKEKPANVYYAKDPSILKENFLKSWKAQLASKEVKLQETVEELLSLQETEKFITNPDNISVSNTFPEIFSAIREAKYRVWIVASGKGGMYNWSETADSLAKLVNSGVDVTYIVDKPVIPQILHKYFAPLLDEGKSIKALYQKSVPHNLLIVDDNLFIINIRPDRSSIEKVQHPDIIKTYVLFLKSMIGS